MFQLQHKLYCLAEEGIKVTFLSFPQTKVSKDEEEKKREIAFGEI